MILIARKYPVFFVLLFLSGNACAQNRFQYPTALSQFFNYYPLLNPASTGTGEKFTLRAGEQVNAGYYSRIRTLFALSEFAINPGDAKSHNAFGLSFMNNKEGNLLSFNRVYLHYAYHLAVSEKWKIASGISAGFLNLSVEQTATSASVSSYAPDGSFGFWVYSNTQRIGFSSSQLLNKSIRVISERIPIARFYTLFYSRDFILSPTVKFLPALLYSIKNEGHSFDLNASMLLEDLIFFGISYRYDRGSAYFLGIKDFSFLGGRTDVTVSYNAPWPASNLGNIQTFEVILSYKVGSKSEAVE